MENAEHEQPLGYRPVDTAQRVNTMLRHVYAWMAVGLGVSAAVALLIERLVEPPVFVMYICGALLLWFLASIILAVILQRLNPTVAGVLFFLYCALTGCIFPILTASLNWGEIVLAFASTAGLFVVMTIFAYTTSIDFTRFGPYFLLLFLGLILAGLVNFAVFHSSLAASIGSFLGVALFILFAIYNAQVIKKRIEQDPDNRSYAIYGAFALYLTFVTIFLVALRVVFRPRPVA